LTGALGFKPPILSKRADTEYVGAKETALILPTFRAKNNMANMPMATKIPTQTSIALFLIRTSVYSEPSKDRS
jgi:hypothetical protein